MPEDSYQVLIREQRIPNGRWCRKNPSRRIVTVGFDDEILAVIIEMAVKSRCSMSEQIRTLVEWGLESCKEQLP